MSSRSHARFAELYEAHYKDVHAYCRRRLGPDLVDDAASEVFLVAWKKLDAAPSDEALLPWLYRVAYGVVTNSWRGARRRDRLDRRLLGLGSDSGDIPEDVVVMRHEARQIFDALSNLQPSDQEILRLAVWEELSGGQIAIALGVSHESARKRLSRARRKLADEYNRLEVKGNRRRHGGSEVTHDR